MNLFARNGEVGRRKSASWSEDVAAWVYVHCGRCEGVSVDTMAGRGESSKQEGHMHREEIFNWVKERTEREKGEMEGGGKRERKRCNCTKMICPEIRCVEKQEETWKRG